jgi:hypothetical protein
VKTSPEHAPLEFDVTETFLGSVLDLIKKALDPIDVALVQPETDMNPIVLVYYFSDSLASQS